MVSRTDHNNPKSAGNFGPSYHYEMIADINRIAPFRACLKRIAKNKTVIESGTGTGILSLLAAKFGAEKVYATEIDPVMAEIARKNFAESGFDNITLIEGDTLQLSSPDINGDLADIIIAENLSTWQVTEPQIQVMNYLNKNFSKSGGAQCLPQKIYNNVQLTHAEYRFQDLVNLKVYFFEFSGITPAASLSKTATVNIINFSDPSAENFNFEIEMEANQDGLLNSVRLTSPLDFPGDFEFDSTDSLMPPVVVPLKQELSVKAGETVVLKLDFKTLSAWENFSAEAVLKSIPAA